MSTPKLFSIADAAAEVGASEKEVRGCIADRVVDAQQVAGRWVLTEDQVEKLRDEFEDDDEDDETDDDE